MAILGQVVETAGRHLLPELFEGTTEVGKQLWKTVPAQDKATAKWLAKHDLPRHKRYTTAVDNGDTLTMSSIADEGGRDARAFHEQEQVGKIGQKEVDIKAWNIFDEVTSEKNATLYKELAEKNPKSFLEDGFAYQNQLNLQEEGSLFKYTQAQGNEVNAEFAAFLQTVDPETRASYIDLLLEAADGDELAQVHLRNQFKTFKAERLPAEQLTQRGREGITPEDINLGKEATDIQQSAQKDFLERGMSDQGLSAGSTGPELVTGDPRIYNLGTKAREIYKKFEQLLKGVDLPTLQWHHKFQKAVSTPYFQRAWDLVESGDATVEDIIAMHRYALDQGVGAGDRLSAIMMLERIPHTELHNFAKAMGLELSPAKVKGTKVSKTGRLTRRRPTTNSELKQNSNRISKIGTIAELAEDFQRSVQNAVFITEEGMKIQKAWNAIPVAERSRLAHFHNLRKVQSDLLRKNSRKKLSPGEIAAAEKEQARLNSIYKNIKDKILETLEANRGKQNVDEKVPFSKSKGG